MNEEQKAAVIRLAEESSDRFVAGVTGVPTEAMLRDELDRLRAQYAELKSFHKERILQCQRVEDDYREIEAERDRLCAALAASETRITTLEAASILLNPDNAEQMNCVAQAGWNFSHPLARWDDPDNGPARIEHHKALLQARAILIALRAAVATREGT
jgi:hypothetical protein